MTATSIRLRPGSEEGFEVAARAIARAGDRWAGALYVLAGCVAMMGIITAEALYPLVYTTGGNEISDLGGTRPPAGLVLQPSSTIFNLTMMATGLVVLLGTLVSYHRLGRVTALVVATLGASVLGVGIFPGNTGTPHAILAMVAFWSGGLAAVMTARLVAAPLRYVLGLLGMVNLVSLGSYFVLGDANPFWVLGVGGAERWVAYPVLLWLIGFGGYLAATPELDRTAASSS